MAQKPSPGLFKRGEIWHINKTIAGCQIRESTGVSDLTEAERYLNHRIQQVRAELIYGIRRERSFREAATKYLLEYPKATLKTEAQHLRLLDPYIGDLALQHVHIGSLQKFIEHRRKEGRKTRTINYALQVVRHILNLAAGEWIDETGKTWLAHAPRIKLLPQNDQTAPYPLTWTEQERLFVELPDYIRRMALFKVNVGLRDQEVCSLRWDWEVFLPELNTSVFLLPRERVKNREDRLVVLNSIAREVIDEVRGEHAEYVFTFKGDRIYRIYNTAWKKARIRAELPHVRVHDLKHTYGCRLRAAGVSLETRQDLLGHKNGKITSHYSAPEVIGLLEASERVCRVEEHKQNTTILLRQHVRRLRAV